MSKAEWAIPTWVFFHGFAEKVDETYYNNNYKKCFDIIRKICHNLPCETCRLHAVEKMNQTNSNMINTKEKLKLYLFNFHNEVSSRVNKPVYDISILERYTKFVPLKGYMYFTKCFFKRYFSLHFNQWKRDMLLRDLNKTMLEIWHDLFPNK
jgi:hypothetical protein